jgi:hypothetical protein
MTLYDNLKGRQGKAGSDDRQTRGQPELIAILGEATTGDIASRETLPGAGHRQSRRLRL